MGFVSRTRDLTVRTSLSRVSSGSARPGSSCFDLDRPASKRLPIVGSNGIRSRSSDSRPCVDLRPDDVNVPLLTHSLINKRTFTTPLHSAEMAADSCDNSWKCKMQILHSHNSKFEQELDKVSPHTPIKPFGTPKRPPRLPISSSTISKDSALVDAGAHLARAARCTRNCLESAEPRPASVDSNSCSSNASQPCSARSGSEQRSRSRTTKSVSFARDCKAAPPATITMILSLYRNTSDEAPSPESKTAGYESTALSHDICRSTEAS